MSDKKLEEFAKAFGTLISTIDPVANSKITPENTNVKLLCDWGRKAIEELNTKQASKDEQIKQLKAENERLKETNALIRIGNSDIVEHCKWQKAKLDAQPDMVKLKEKLAYLCHKQWSGWMDYLFSKCRETRPDDGGKLLNSECLIIPEWAVKRWKKQSQTDYIDLSEQEKDSDRTEADKFLALLNTESSPLLDSYLDRTIKALDELIPKAQILSPEHDMLLAELEAMKPELPKEKPDSCFDCSFLGNCNAEAKSKCGCEKKE